MNDMNSHWTKDEERLEQYVLGLIPGKERLLLERHLQMCRECALRVQSEEAIKQAIRLEGRSLLKADLKKKLVGDVAVGSFNWQWAAAAAVIVGVGFWYVYKGNDPVPLSNGQFAEREILPTPSPMERDTAGIGERPPDQYADQRQSDADRPLLGPERTDAASSASGAGQMQQRVGEAEAGRERSTEDRIAALEGMPMTSGDDALPKDVWVVAVIEEESRSDEDKRDMADVGAEQQKELAARAVQAPATAQKSEVGKIAEQSRSKAKQTVNIRQELQSALPRAQQASLAKDGARTIPTKLRQRGDTLQVTLYAEPPIRQSRLDQATFVQQSADTLLILLVGQRIVVPLPGAVQKK